ncbi:DNA topoisomerase [Blyttiomyces helicus]|uniref:DNA topoisomerase 2 n=1 Tax=Blyttiomyces helicus TaxID=388810 RepID=A0A4P9WHG7_9FUNG|nr:DNA topoisomerase [Blyttiomyces helicus]|eukprot:RKO91293.1 DNA topoisomerase [Blyttiomyces helicus]
MYGNSKEPKTDTLESLVNASDNKISDLTTDTIKVNIERENNQISNFNDSEKRMTGGRNGLGAKLTNIYSEEYTLETHSSKSGLTYKQTWKQSMRTYLPYKITKSRKKKDYTNCISIYLELQYGKGSDNKAKIVYNLPYERWEVAVAVTESGSFQHGGTNVTYVADKIIMEFIDVIRKKEKTATVKPAQVKNQLLIFINCLIENPTFDSQTKENMTLRPSHFRSTCIVGKTISMIREKEGLQLKKTDGQKQSHLSGIAILNDANEARGRKSKLCTFALTFAVTGNPVVPQGRDHYGAFPLHGNEKLENSEITHLKQNLGSQDGKEYSSVDSLRYGHLCILVDSDLDRTHIKGLILNWLETSFSSLLCLPGFLLDLRSPIMICSKRNDVQLFYTQNEYEGWKKRLGTSKESDIKSYFGKITNHIKRFRELIEDDSENIDMVFSKKRALDRKNLVRILQLEDIVSIQDFIDKDLIEFSMYDNIRSIPCVVDGLKPGQRKILFTAFKTNMKKGIKVAQFSADQSLCETTIRMSQDYVRRNSIALFSPERAFGTLLEGGKDATSPQYIYTKLANINRTVFPWSDDAILDYLNEDSFIIEPKFHKITAEIPRCTKKIRFISSFLEGTLVLNNRKKADIIEDLGQAMFVRHENSFNHLINLPLHSLSEDKIESMKSELDAMEVQYGIITSQTAEEMYKSDLLCLLEYQSTK